MITKETTYHFVGIKGSGMSALALILHGEGYRVQGSDVDKYFFTQDELEKRQIPMFVFDEKNITEGLTIIAGNAFADDHEELVKARELNLPIYRYHHFLGTLIDNYTSIAITGSHGKTSTTGLMSHTLSHLAPTSYLIGDGTGFGDEKASYFALEACEYRRHFMAYQADYAIITNVDFDHPDYYSDIEEVFAAFQDFANQTRKAIVAWGNDVYLRKLQVDIPIYYYGLDDTADVYADNIQLHPEGANFDVYIKGEKFGNFRVPSLGEHNVLNALAVITVLKLEGFSASAIAEHLATFGGVKRRFSETKIDELVIVDDYAHHPTEITATIKAAKQRYPHKQCVAIFQPHTYTRTKALLNEFADALNTADVVYLADIFESAREKTGDIKIDDLAHRISKFEHLIEFNHLEPLMYYKDAVLVFMGAGDIDKIAKQFETLYRQAQ